MDKLLLVDGNSIINRAFYAVIGRAPMTAPDGTPTGAVNGFFNSVLSVIDEYKPGYVCVLFDRREPTFRHKMSSEYKANRHGMPDELAMQMPVVKEILDLASIKRMELSGYEADDLIGTLSKQAEDKGMEVYIYSGDHDDYQLISDRVSVIMPQSGKGKEPRVLIDRNKFTGDYGVDPSVFVQVKALMGDNSDNIKGIDKVGEKTAFKLIKEYGSAMGVYENRDKLTPALKAKFEGAAELITLNLKLCEIDRSSPVPYGVEETVYSPDLKDSERQALADKLLSLGLKKINSKFGLSDTAMSGQAVNSEELSPVIREHAAILDKLITDGVTFNDTSKLSLAAADELRYGVSFVKSQNSAFVLVIDLEDKAFYKLTPDEARDIFGKANDLMVAGFRYKESSKILPFSLKSVTSVFDTEVAGFVTNKIEGKSDFDRLFYAVCKMPYPVSGRKENVQMSLFDEGPSIEDAVKDEACRLYANIMIAKAFEDELKTDDKTRKLLYEIEFPLVITLDAIERVGMNVSYERLNVLHREYSMRLEDLSARIFDLAGMEFNINSPKQLSDVLFSEDKLNLPHGKKSKTGAYSTGIDELKKLVYKHPVIKFIIDYRELSKLDSTYAAGLVRSIGDDGRIHTTFTQAMTNTGRLSSAEPNLQNIPVRTTEGSRLRAAFTAPEGRILVDSDYSQIELRLLAAMSGDEVMSEAFINGEDIHRRTAAKIYGVDEDMVTSKMRSSAKTVNFSIIYGISDYGLATDLGIGYQEAADLIKEYSAQFPGIMNYLDSLKKKGEKDGFVETLYGRRRYLTELKSQNRNLRNFGLRAAMNMPIQGTAADIIKIAMNKVYKALKAQFPTAKLVMQVHDELIVECDEADGEAVSELLKSEMESAVSLSVPLVCECNTGKDWLSAK